MAMTRRERAREMREDGMTYQQIADKLGCSKACVARFVGAHNPFHFRIVTKEGCIYPGLREWMNDNKVGRTELAQRMSNVAWPCAVSTLSGILRGHHVPSKTTVDSILKATGMTYEECFGGAENG